jgi:hypothetical protein
MGGVYSEPSVDSGGVDLMDLAIMYPPAGGTDNMSWAKALFRKQSGFVSDDALLEELSTRGFWPKALGSQALLPQSVFDDIILQARGNPPAVVGAGVKFEIRALSGTKNWGREKPRDEYDVLVDMAEPDRWRATSFRYEPCPYSVHHGLPATEATDHDGDEENQGSLVSGSEPTKKSQSLRYDLCQPEFRLVIQPFLGKSKIEKKLGATLPFVRVFTGGQSQGEPLSKLEHEALGWFATDYAMHLFYRLSPEESKSMAMDLKRLKTSFGNLCKTTGVPLQVHPCLISEAIGAGSQDGIRFAEGLRKIFMPRTNGLHKVAFFGSENNASPWTFFAGNVRADSTGSKRFVLSRIRALDSFESSARIDGKYSSKEGSKDPIGGDGVAQAARERMESLAETTSRLSKLTIFGQRKGVFLQRNVALGYAKPEDVFKQRISPAPIENRDSLAAFVTGTVGFQTQKQYDEVRKYDFRRGLTNITPSGKREADVLQVTARIENPVLNNEFRVDCVSCHMSNMEASHAAQKLDVRTLFVNQMLERLQTSVPATNPWEFPIEWTPAGQFKKPQGLTAFRMAPSTVSPKGERAMVYMLNQFSFYTDHPVVSARVVNEAAESAEYVNRVYLDVRAPWRHSCDKIALEACLTTVAKGEIKRDAPNSSVAPAERFDWYAAFLKNQECFSPDRRICSVE